MSSVDVDGLSREQLRLCAAEMREALMLVVEAMITHDRALARHLTPDMEHVAEIVGARNQTVQAIVAQANSNMELIFRLPDLTANLPKSTATVN